jgi:hypothetical protein
MKGSRFDTGPARSQPAFSVALERDESSAVLGEITGKQLTQILSHPSTW